MKYLLSIIFIFVFSFVAYGQTNCTSSFAGSGNIQSQPSNGGQGIISVISPPGCLWQIEGGADWVVFTTSRSGIGNGSANYTATVNRGAPRSATLKLNEQVFTINQEGVTPTPTPQNCLFLISPSTQEFTSAGGTGTVTVSGQAGCPYASLNELSYLTLDSGAEGSGSGTVTFTVSPNSGTARTGTIFIAGQDFRINQAAGKSRKRVRFF
jgi:hypothetical protein